MCITNKKATQLAYIDTENWSNILTVKIIVAKTLTLGERVVLQHFILTACDWMTKIYCVWLAVKKLRDAS